MQFRLRTLMIVLAVGLPQQSAWFTVLLIAVGIAAMITWPAAAYYLVMTTANKKPNTGPFYGIGFTENLSEDGIKYRRKLLYAVLGFVIPILVVMLIGFLTGQP